MSHAQETAIQVKRINSFILFLLLATLSAMLDNAMGNSALKFVSLACDVCIILYCYVIGRPKYVTSAVLKYPVILCLIIVAFNFVFSPYQPEWSFLVKYFGYLVLFISGYSLARNSVKLRCNEILLWITVTIPLIIVALLDKTPDKSLFFSNSNTFVYVGLCFSLLLYYLEDASRKMYYAVGLLLAYILVGSSLGIIVAILGALIIINIKRIRLSLFLGVALSIFLFVNYSDLSVAIRIRDTMTVFQSMDASDWKHIDDINLYELQQRSNISGERTDNTSALWRMLHWTNLFKCYVSSVPHIPFGLGVNYSVYTTNYSPHNDFLRVLIEFGCVIFVFICVGLIRVYKSLKTYHIFFFFLSIFLYHLTENLVGNFPPNCVFYFVLGFCYSETKIIRNNESFINQ